MTTDTNSTPDASALNDAERRLLEAAPVGKFVDLRVRDRKLDIPGEGMTWSADRTVRAELLIKLLSGERIAQSGPSRAVKLRGARIIGPLDLEARVLTCPLLLKDCYIDEPVSLNDASAPAIRLPGCHLAEFSANQLRTNGNLELGLGFTVRGMVQLAGAHIGGNLSMVGACLNNTQGPALRGDSLTVEQNMWCRWGFIALNEVRLPYAHVGGEFSLDGASLTGRYGSALFADALTVDGHVSCERLAAKGEVRVVGARIGGQLSMPSACLENSGGRALDASRLTVGQDAFFRGKFSSLGEINLIGAHIGGQLDLAGASLTNSEGPALSADGLIVDDSIFCCNGFTATGEIRLIGARIGGDFSLRSASLAGSASRALAADWLNVGHSVLCVDGFTADGEIRLAGAHIGGQLVLNEASLTSDSEVALNVKSASVAALYFLPGRPPGGIVDLTNTRVGVFADDPASWPATVRLRGFTYDALENDAMSVRDRLGWLNRHPTGYVPQIFDQLEAAYGRAGNEEAARKVAISKQQRRRTVLNPAGKLANWLLYLTVGYGYRTWLAGVWLAGLLLAGTWVFGNAYPTQMIAAKTHPPAFHPLAYTLDVLLPVVDLGQQRAWQPQGPALYWSWALTGAGWLLTTAVVAGLTGVLKRG